MKNILFNQNSNISVIIAGIISLFIGVGIARFSYTSLLPYMLDDKVLSLNFSGVLASINYVGYLSGAILAIFIKDFNLKIKLFRIGLILCIFTTFLMGISTNEFVWLFSRIVAGFGSAMLLVVGAAIVMMKLNFEDKTKAMGIYFAGIGIALSSSDLIARFTLNYFTWNISWIVLTIVGLALFIQPFYVLSPQKSQTKTSNVHISNKAIFTPFVVVLIFAYFTEGVGFVIQGTFLPTIIKTLPGLEEFSGLTWLLVGLAGIPASIIWMRMAFKHGSVNMIIIAMLIQVVGIMIPTMSTNIYLNLFCGIIYGATFVGLVALFMNLGGKLAGSHPVMLMGALTTAYGIGQVTAPLYAVKLTTLSGNYDLALYVTASIVLTGAIVLIVAKKVLKVNY